MFFDFQIIKDTDSENPSYIDVPITYYPGYQVLLGEEQRLDIESSPTGVVRIFCLIMLMPGIFP